MYSAIDFYIPHDCNVNIKAKLTKIENIATDTYIPFKIQL